MRGLEQADWPPSAITVRREAEFFVELSEPCPSFKTALDLARTILASFQQAGDSDNTCICRKNLAWAEVQAGRLDDSIRHGLELLEQRAGDPRYGQTMALIRKNLVAAWALKGGVAEARAHARAAWPQVLLFETFIDHLADSLALIAALEGRVRTAARLRAYAEAVRARYQSAQWAAEIRIAGDADPARARTARRGRVRAPARGRCAVARRRDPGAGVRDRGQRLTPGRVAGSRAIHQRTRRTTRRVSDRASISGHRLRRARPAASRSAPHWAPVNGAGCLRPRVRNRSGETPCPEMRTCS